MPETPATTRDRIQQAALDLFLQRGIRKTSIDDVAERVGVTRVTVYRHFSDRQQLIEAAFLLVNEALSGISEALTRENSLDAFLERMATELTSVPSGFISGLAELETLHPEIHAELRRRRVALLRAIFDELYLRAERENRIRRGLDKEVIEALFWEVVMTLPESPRLAALGLGTEELYTTLSSLLLYGLLDH